MHTMTQVYKPCTRLPVQNFIVFSILRSLKKRALHSDKLSEARFAMEDDVRTIQDAIVESLSKAYRDILTAYLSESCTLFKSPTNHIVGS